MEWADCQPAIEFIKAALAFHEQGNMLQKEREMWVKALEILIEALGDDHPTVAIILIRIGCTLAAQGHLTKAMEKYQRALEIQQEKLAKNDLATADTYARIGCVFLQQEDFEKSEEMYRKALATAEKAQASDQPFLSRIYSNLAVCLRERGKVAEAVKILRRALGTKLKHYGDDHPTVAKDYNDIGVLLMEQDRLQEAEIMFTKALGIVETSEQFNATLTSSILTNQASMHTKEGNYKDYKKALKLYEKALALVLEELGEMCPETANLYYSMSVPYLGQGMLKDATAMSAKSLKIRRRLFGDDHPATKRSMGSHRLLLEKLLQNHRG